VNILANALPGFRDLRAPLTAGYIWLVFVWLLFTPNVSTRPSSVVGGAIYDLSRDVGRIWLAVAIGVIAYSSGIRFASVV
jgi:hypothetical protein